MGEPTTTVVAAADAGQRATARAVTAEVKTTTHRVLEKLDRERRGLEILHGDLFDSDQRVVLSALSAIGALRDRRSLKFVQRLAAQEDETVQCAAVETLAAMGHGEVAPFLLDLFRLSRSDAVRRTVLEALGRLAVGNEQVPALLREQSRSHLVANDVRAEAARALVRLKGAAAAAELLRTADRVLVEAVYGAAEGDPPVAAAAVEHGIAGWGTLDATSRASLLRLAAPFAQRGSIRILFDALDDSSQEVRQAAYACIGMPGQAAHAQAIAAALASRTDPSPVLEDEALAALERLEVVVDAEAASAGGREAIDAQVREIFRVLSRADQRVASDSHELGWMIARSREYLEYYADETLRQGIVGYLKGSTNYSAEALLDALKRSAVKVEVRHFDGYTCLADLLKNSRRSGLGLIARELAIARLGRRSVLYGLIRRLRLTRLLGAAGSESASLYTEIFEWARQSRMYRLAEAALYALERVDRERATAGCVECLSLPLASKICAIAAVRLMKGLEWERLEPSVITLLERCGDTHVLLNLVDALAGLPAAPTAPTIKAVMSLFASGAHQETLQAAARFLAGQPSLDLLERIAACYEPAPPWKRALALGILERWVVEDRVPARDAVVEVLYRILRAEASGVHRARAAVLLLRLGDDYALDLLAEAAREGRADECVQAIRSLNGAVTARLGGLLHTLMTIERPDLQSALAETLAGVTDAQSAARVRDLVLSVRGMPGIEADEPAADVQVDLPSERTRYRFEREHIREMAVVFSDIQGYSKKAQALSTMQIAALLQEYEGILLPTITAHRGEVIKKMGDGHLFVFASALDAVLAAIRLQKALKRFNYYREEVRRVIIRVGIDWGKIIRKEGDVLGNHVNIASRLETAAAGGSILVSAAVQERLGGHIHSREVGPITVKGISEPITVCEPYEISIDFPKDLDPLNASAASPSTTEARPADRAASRTVVTLDRKGLEFLVETFSHLHSMCRKASLNEIPVDDIGRELAIRWKALRKVLVSGDGQ